MGRCGLAVDNLLSVDIVTADGRVQRASPADDADLFWAVRGAGANFGVAASLEHRLHPVGPTITGGLVAYPFDKAREVLRFYRQATASLADEFTIFAGLIHAPDGTKLAAVVLCHSGPLDAGATAAGPIKSFGAPLMDTVGPMSYCDLNAMLDAAYPKGALSYWKSNFLARLSDDAIDTMIDPLQEAEQGRELIPGMGLARRERQVRQQRLGLPGRDGEELPRARLHLESAEEPHRQPTHAAIPVGRP